MHNEQNSSQKLALLKPDIIGAVVPSDAVAQKAAFLAGEVRNPRHHYARLERDYVQDMGTLITTGNNALDELGQRRPKLESVYNDSIEDYVESNELMYYMDRYDKATSPTERLYYRSEVMRLNTELYGAPARSDYHHVLASYISSIDDTHLKGDGLAVYAELVTGLPTIEDIQDEGGYQPRPETMAWMQEMVENLYGSMLAHVADGREYGPADIQALFSAIISSEFGEEVASEWRVDIEPARVITVNAVQKRIIIPVDRKPVSSEKMKDLVVHEIGVHMLRSVCGYETDIPLLATGMKGYADSEEGLAVVVEQARKGKFHESGHLSYLAASLAYFEGMDFRATFETLWRIIALKSAKGTDMTSEAIEKAKASAYGVCLRTFRGTDDIPWFKDLQYYNGSIAVWKHLDSIAGDVDAFQCIIMGKTNIDDQAQARAVLEAKTL